MSKIATVPLRHDTPRKSVGNVAAICVKIAVRDRWPRRLESRGLHRFWATRSRIPFWEFHRKPGDVRGGLSVEPVMIGLMLNRSSKITIALAGVTLAALALVGCSVSGAPEPAEQPSSPASVVSSAAEAASKDGVGCTSPAWINLTPEGASVTGLLEDQGEREYARGVVGFNENGKITSYTVAPGDALGAIGERLCIKNGPALSELNHTRTIHPDQVLRLTADPNLLFIPYYNPWDAPAGFEQIPYQEAIEAMGRAADAGDVDTMRAIWADTLSGMFTDPADIKAIQQALDAGDLDVLTEMFS